MMFQKNSVINGRILESGSYKDTQAHAAGLIEEAWIELVMGSERLIYFVQDPSELSNINRGDLVSLILDHSGKVTQIVRLGGPAAASWDPLSDGMRWRRALSGPSRMLRLQQRQWIIQAIREDFYQNGFLEVETPLLVRGTCPDTHIESIEAGEGYLVTSTEYQIKRMMVGGFEKVFTLTKNFRANDRGRFHSSEFTMLEWARAYGSLAEIEEDVIRFTQRGFQALYPGQECLSCFAMDGKESQIHFIGAPWERLTVREAFRLYLNIEDVEDFSLEALSRASKRAGISIPEIFKEDRHGVISYLLDLVQPNLGRNVPTFLREWPAFMTSSAQLSPHDPAVAERSELYIGGIEISDGFPFLRDAQMQRDLFAREVKRREDEGKKSVRLDDRYVEALAQGIPPGAGMALGVDRLVMVLTGSSRLSEVQAFEWDEI